MKQKRNWTSRWLGQHAKWLLGTLVVVVAVVPSFWLAVLEQRARSRFVYEVENGLSKDAVDFAQRFTGVLEEVLYELPDAKHARIVVNAGLVREKLRAIVEDEDLRKYIL